MPDSLLVEALTETRVALEDVGLVAGARDLLARTDVLERAATMLELRPAPKEDVVRLARLVIEVRDEAVEMRRLTRIAREAAAQTMD